VPPLSLDYFEYVQVISDLLLASEVETKVVNVVFLSTYESDNKFEKVYLSDRLPVS
jgi:hypothetical protein